MKTQITLIAFSLCFTGLLACGDKSKKDDSVAKTNAVATPTTTKPAAAPVPTAATPADKGPQGGVMEKSLDHQMEYIFDDKAGTIKVWILKEDATLMNPDHIPPKETTFKIAVGTQPAIDVKSTGNNVDGYFVQHDSLKGATQWIARVTVEMQDHGKLASETLKFGFPTTKK